VGIPAPLKPLDLTGQGGWAVKISVLLIVGIWLAHTGFGLPPAIYLLYIDGATPFHGIHPPGAERSSLSPCAAGRPSDRQVGRGGKDKPV
jgi:hypothetical protein